MVTTRGSQQSAFVTGGSGFLGEHIVQQLLAAGYLVTVFDIQPCTVPGATSIVGDLTQRDDVLTAVTGHDIVFHVASAAPTAQNAASARELMMSINVDGTQNIIDACRNTGVGVLVYTSSASVVFAGQALVDVDESHPYAWPPMDFYTGTKMEAEKLVLAANSQLLATCALRPSGIFGPGKDRLLVPSVAKRGASGKIKYIIGSGDNVFTWTYVGNVAAAHLAAATALSPGSPAAGEAFFITNDEEYGFWTMLGDLSEGLGYARPSVCLPVWLMMIFAYLVTFCGAVFGLQSDLNPMRVRIASVQRTMSCAKASRMLGYKPKTPLAEGIRLTVDSFAHLHKDAASERKEA